MTSCSKTAYTLGKAIAPSWNSAIMKKNRIYEHEKMLESKWSVAHLYIQHSPGAAHEVILNRKSQNIVIYDSFMGHRRVTSRSLKEEIFHDMFLILFTGTKEHKIIIYQTLFDPPTGYLDGWDGEILRAWLSPLVYNGDNDPSRTITVIR